jgi:hypothetical protein
MSPRVLFAFSGFLACLWAVGQSNDQQASANLKDYYCNTVVTSLCPCDQLDTWCCPRGQYGPILYSCQPNTGATCANTDVYGAPLQAACPGFYHLGTCSTAPAITCFHGQKLQVTCQLTFSGTCAPAAPDPE